jgi:hypothetical protein
MASATALAARMFVSRTVCYLRLPVKGLSAPEIPDSSLILLDKIAVLGFTAIMNSTKFLSQIQQSELSTETFYTRWNYDDTMLAVACGDGATRVYQPFTGKLLHTLDSNIGERRFPITSLCWRPTGETSKTKNILVTVSC